MNLFKKPLLGIDMGSRTVKGIRLQKKGDRLVLDDYFFVDLASPEGSGSQNFSSTSESNKIDSLECLKASVEVRNLKNARAAVSIPDREVIRLALDLPAMKSSELRMAVGHELSENTGIAESELAFDFTENKKSATSGDSIGITAYGTSRKTVEQVVKTMNEAKLRPDLIESDTLAISSMLEFNDYIDDEGSYIVFDMGESHLTASLISAGELKLSRSSEVGWGNVNTTLSERFGISYGEGEEAKLRYDFNSSNKKEEQTEHAIDDVYASIISEIKKSIEIFREFSSDTANITNVILVGGGSQTKNLGRVLEMYFKIPTVVANPFRNIDIFSKKNAANADEIAILAPYMAAAVGLALIGLAKMTPTEGVAS